MSDVISRTVDLELWTATGLELGFFLIIKSTRTGSVPNTAY